MFDAYNQFKDTIPGEALLLLAAFLGATVHAIKNRQVPLVEGMLGAVSGIIIGVMAVLLIRLVMGYTLKDIWFLGVPGAYMSNYLLGGMDTVGKQFSESPLKVFTQFITTLADEVLAKINQLKSPKP